MWYSLRSLAVVLLMIAAAAAYVVAHPLKMDFETVRAARSDPLDAQYANNFYRGYGSNSRFGPGAEMPNERYW
ncbi:hypothetical protein Q1695_012772 [Nippostrongylus brasiliensis]|nr:hypothetical protein Q1695_012772 [Nippostrongylus brasiliensis]